jgi:hypothetical protein
MGVAGLTPKKMDLSRFHKSRITTHYCIANQMFSRDTNHRQDFFLTPHKNFENKQQQNEYIYHGRGRTPVAIKKKKSPVFNLFSISNKNLTP